MNEQHASAVPLPHERQVYPVVKTPDDIYQPYYVEDEAFYPDEASDTVTARGLRHNKFATIGEYERERIENPILPHELTSAELAAFQGTDWIDGGYELYAAPGTSAATPLKITLFFAVGTELRRFGLRSLFQQPGRVIIRVPGIESGWSGKPIARAWGVGVDEAVVNALLDAAGLAGASWSIDVLAAYSTGYRGLNGTVLHSAVTNTLDLGGVSVVVIYDCLYRADQPSPGKNTMRALESIDTRTGQKARLAVYEVTGAGTPRDANGDTTVSQTWLQQLSQRNDGHIARLVDSLPPRWTVASTTPPIVPGTTPLATWAAANAADIDKLHAPKPRKSTNGGATYGNDRDYINGDFINRFNLAGWRADMGERLHDSFIPELGHEFLRGLPPSP